MTAEEVISRLKDSDNLQLPNGRILERCQYHENASSFVQYHERGSNSVYIHYEVNANESSDPGNSVRVQVDVEDDYKPKSTIPLREELIRLADANSERFTHTRRQTKSFRVRHSQEINCQDRDFDEQIKPEILEKLQELYDTFETTLCMFEPTFCKLEDNMNDIIQSLLETNLNVILTGAPGTGKTYTAKTVARKMVGAIVPEDATEEEKNAAKTAEEERIESVQFHPGYDYSDFVIGMKPVLVSNDGKEVFEDESGRLYTTANNKKDGKPTDFSGTTSVSFVWRDGIFKQFADKAKNDLGNNYVFLIDEINRADLSRVFGELFSLLEEEYRYSKNADGTEVNAKGITLPNGKNFVIPRNLYIIGTMNDIDRSVESMDFALRRRFAWKEVTAEDSVTIVDAKAKEGKITEWDANLLKGALKALNSLIAPSKADEQPDANQSAKTETPDLRLGREYQLGGAIFAKLEKYVKDADGNVRDATPDNFDALWTNHIENILSEYLRGRRDRDDTLKALHNAYQEAYKKEVVLPKDEENAADPGGANGQDVGVAKRQRGENKKFQINYRGEVIQGKNGTETLVAFVKKLLDKDILTIADNPQIQRSGRCFLVKKDPNDNDNYTYVDTHQCYILTKSDTEEKIRQVNTIAKILDLGNVSAELVND